MIFSWNVLGCGEDPDTQPSMRHDLLSCREMVGLGPSRAEQGLGGKFAPKLWRKTLHWAWTRKWGFSSYFMVLGENIQHKLGAKCCTFLITSYQYLVGFSLVFSSSLSFNWTFVSKLTSQRAFIAIPTYSWRSSSSAPLFQIITVLNKNIEPKYSTMVNPRVHVDLCMETIFFVVWVWICIWFLR